MARSTPKKKRAKKPAPKARKAVRTKPAPKPSPRARGAQKARKAVPMRQCRTCRQVKPREDYRGPGGGLYPSCSACREARRWERRQEREAEREARRDARDDARRKRPKAPQKPRQAAQKPTKRELRKLARKDWAELKKREQAALRSWRGQKAAKTVFRRRWERVAEELSGTHGREARERARALIREEGSAGLARWLKEQSKLPKGRARSAEVRRRFAFWMYAP